MEGGRKTSSKTEKIRNNTHSNTNTASFCLYTLRIKHMVFVQWFLRSRVCVCFSFSTTRQVRMERKQRDGWKSRWKDVRRGEETESTEDTNTRRQPRHLHQHHVDSVKRKSINPLGGRGVAYIHWTVPHCSVQTGPYRLLGSEEEGQDFFSQTIWLLWFWIQQIWRKLIFIKVN